jgi:hypothetical protein
VVVRPTAIALKGREIQPGNREHEIEYVSNQDEHHKRLTFQDEYRAFLKRYHIAFDERYVWD